MASAAARSICLFRDESIGAASLAVTILADRSSHMKLLCHHGKARATMWTGIKTTRRLETKCCQESHCRSESSCSGLPLPRKEEVSSLRGSRSRVPKVTEIALEIFQLAREWSQRHVTKLVALAACAFLIIPSADAVDALKTCACLLKECRYFLRSVPWYSASCLMNSRSTVYKNLMVHKVLQKEASQKSEGKNSDERKEMGLGGRGVEPLMGSLDSQPLCILAPAKHEVHIMELIADVEARGIELAKCIANPSCAANVACLQTCNNRPDETECQIKCGDLFENSVVDEFNECAVSRKKCVPQKSDVGEFPVPDPAVLVKSFNIADFSGKWFISSGLNPTFDTFDCQLHEFHTESNKLVGNLSWRIRTPDSAFFTRTAVQRFVQDPEQPAILYNHDNEYLHYQDDWYILSSKTENEPDDYIFVYYRGRNDAWDGYGGAVVYTRSAVLPGSIVPELERAVKSVGRNFRDFIRTDNTCGPEPPLVERIEKTVEEGEKTIVREVEQIEDEVQKVGKTEMTLLQRLAEGFKELRQDEENFLRDLGEEEMELLNELKMEATEVEKLFGRALPIRKLR